MKIGLLFSKNRQKLEYKTAPKVQKLNTRQASIEEFTVYVILENIISSMDNPWYNKARRLKLRYGP